MNWSGKIIPIILALGLITFIVGINLLDMREFKYDLAGLICTFLGALVLIPGLVITFVMNHMKKRGEQKVRYGRFEDKR